MQSTNAPEPSSLPFFAYFASLRLCAKLPLLLLCACSAPGVPVPGSEDAYKTAAAERAKRRAFEGAPPVIAHEPLGADCSACHTMRGIHVEGLGFAPPSPHRETAGMSAISRCRQCHVFRQADTLFADSTFVGFQQDLRLGSRLYGGAPPVIPHQTFMRENCSACHTGPAAREEVRTSHPERVRCRQCHVSALTASEWARTRIPDPPALLPRSRNTSSARLPIDGEAREKDTKALAKFR